MIKKERSLCYETFAIKQGYTPMASSSMSKTGMLLWVGDTMPFLEKSDDIKLF